MARSYDLTSGSIPQHLLRLAAPLIMGSILQQLYNTVDAFILGRFAAIWSSPLSALRAR